MEERLFNGEIQNVLVVIDEIRKRVSQFVKDNMEGLLKECALMTMTDPMDRKVYYDSVGDKMGIEETATCLHFRRQVQKEDLLWMLYTIGLSQNEPYATIVLACKSFYHPLTVVARGVALRAPEDKHDPVFARDLAVFRAMRAIRGRKVKGIRKPHTVFHTRTRGIFFFGKGAYLPIPTAREKYLLKMLLALSRIQDMDTGEDGSVREIEITMEERESDGLFALRKIKPIPFPHMDWDKAYKVDHSAFWFSNPFHRRCRCITIPITS